MWENSLVLPVALMLITSIIFYELNLRFLYDGHLTIMIWMAVGVPLLVITLALMAVSASPPRSYAAIAALVGLSNSMLGLGLKVLGIRLGQGRR